MAFAFAASNRFTFPPKVGHRATTAYTIPGTRTSSPNTALPSTFEGVSVRAVLLPTMRNSLGFFKGTLAKSGSGSFEAASTNSP
jgi:hypothetical protein